MDDHTPTRRKILYVANLEFAGTSVHRVEAMKRLGQEVVTFTPAASLPQSRILAKLRYYYPVGPLVSGVNRDLLKMVHRERPDVVWFDKPLFFTPETIQEIKSTGATTVCYNQDNPFGPRNDGCWMQFLRAYRYFDLNCLFRKADVIRYQGWNLPYIELQFSHDPQQNFPPPAEWTDAQRHREVSFTGSPFDDRAEFLMTLAEKHRLPVLITGPRWERGLNQQQIEKYVTGGLLTSDAYRENIWRSKINLAFVTHSNEDDVAHKAFEITACGSFLLAERTAAHLAAFKEDEEAVFFSTVEECADKARYYLDHASERASIASRGRERAITSGYDNDTQLKRVLLKLDGIETRSAI
ncbi:glycosyltransferase [Alloacidobacterium dinghuense]|uniref:Glycosyltransferase n=1 Tax=Alloacidobacterium dinghuense TaxID=2763107 RepID=A0A7G8BIH4_9BACT|nr:glycosyltransferase [Alloacidobacterium dinghuense]QNI32344.1 glycosyltransferase [Alloacidobacterium dinghuense]